MLFKSFAFLTCQLAATQNRILNRQPRAIDEIVTDFGGLQLVGLLVIGIENSPKHVQNTLAPSLILK